jgi:F-type H+-transporting ATPase subunit b
VKLNLRGWLLIVGLLTSIPNAAWAQERAEEGEHGAEAPLTWRRVLLGDVGENASEEQQAEAKHETLSFWGAVVNFSLLLALITWKAKRPLNEFLEQRREELRKGMAEASEAKAKAEAIFQEYNARMASLDGELAKLKNDMATAAQQDKARIVAEAEEATKRLRAETESQIARQVQQLEAQIRHEVVQAAVSAAEKAVREGTNADDQHRLAETFARELAKVGMEKRA